MTSVKDQLVFISYRRADSSAASRWLAQTLRTTFGPQSVFIDTESIRMGDTWPERIDQALDRATILVPVIGPSWLRIADEYGRRRLDKEDDWVCNEINHALEAKLHVVPILLSDTEPPEAEALPKKIKTLSRIQAFELRDDRWESDLSLFLSRLTEFGLKRVSTQPIRYPSPRVSITELTETELSSALEKLVEWRVIASEFPGQNSTKRTELCRVFEFASFKDAIGFMSAAVPKIDEMNHHPRWENIWRSVSVALSTWDIGFVPSQLDIDLANFLEELRSSFPAPKRKKV